MPLLFLLLPLPDAGAQAGKQLVLTASAEPKTFNEILAQETSTTNVTRLIFEGLTTFNTVTEAVEPRLAERWEYSEDGLVWTFFLRKDAHWSDGTPFSARDVLFTFNDLIYNAAIPTASRDVFLLEGKSITVRALDDHTVRFELPSPFAPFLMALNQPIYPRHILREALERGIFASAWGIDAPPASIVGTGPFRLERYLPGERIDLVRNPLYWKRDAAGRRLPYLDRVVILIVPNADMRLLKFLEGEADFYDLTGRDYPLLAPRERRGNFRLYDLGAALGSNFLVFNQRAPDPRRRDWFRSLAFRRAAGHALDRASMIDITFNRLGVHQCAPLSPATPFFFNAGVPCLEHDSAKARALLAQAGFEDRDGDGFREDGAGTKAEFVLLTNAENPDRIQMAGMIREDFARLGVRVHVLPLEFNSLVVKLVATHDWEAALLGLTGEIDPHFGANVWRSEGSLHFWNAGAEKPEPWEERINQIFSAAVAVMEPEVRKRLYDEWQEIAARELALIYTVLPRVLYAVRDRFENLHPTVLGGPFANIEEVDTRS